MLLPANEVWGKVIFLHLSVILLTVGGGGVSQHPPGSHYIRSCTGTTLSWCGGSIQITSNAWWDRSHDTTTPPGRHPLGRHPSWQAKIPQAGSPHGQAPAPRQAPPPRQATLRVGTPLGKHPLPTMVNERAVRILLECILIYRIEKAYLMGYPNVWPFLTKVKRAPALPITPIAAKTVSIVSNIKTPKDLTM